MNVSPSARKELIELAARFAEANDLNTFRHHQDRGRA